MLKILYENEKCLIKFWKNTSNFKNRIGTIKYALYYKCKVVYLQLNEFGITQTNLV